MNGKVVLILIDGMRADAVRACGNAAFVKRMEERATYTLEAQTVMPSVTLPCHMSLFHSVDPARHGITSNVYMPQVRPIAGLIERLDAVDKRCAMYITWEELRDLARPDHLERMIVLNQHKLENTDDRITDEAIAYINADSPDFVFLYLGNTDELGGHDTGWMSETYLRVVDNALNCVERVLNAIPGEYDVIITADHGGHDRSHGSDMPEDMTIPVVCVGPHFAKGHDMGGVSIKDIAPTVLEIVGGTPAREWEGKSFLGK